jgi:hypothetical protein
LLGYGNNPSEIYHQAGAYTGLVLIGANAASTDLSIHKNRFHRQYENRGVARLSPASRHVERSQRSPQMRVIE